MTKVTNLFCLVFVDGEEVLGQKIMPELNLVRCQELNLALTKCLILDPEGVLELVSLLLGLSCSKEILLLLVPGFM